MTAKVITVFNQKGGVGKTTLTMQLAGTLGRRGYQVKVFDMDRQSTATGWAAVAAKESRNFPAEVSNKAPFASGIHTEIQRTAETCDYLLIDCPPAIDSKVAGSALIMADLAIIPIPPRPADYQSSEAAKELAKHSQSMNPGLKLLAVANMVDSSSSSKEILASLAKDTKIPLAKSRLGRRVAFSDSPAYGVTVHDLEDTKKAVEEIEKLATEVLAILGG